jgi:type III secretory pathway component EscT
VKRDKGKKEKQMGIVVVGFAWTALFFVIVEAGGFWKLLPGLVLAVSVVSFTGRLFTGNQTACMVFLYSFYATIFFSMLCVPYLIYKGYDAFGRKYTLFK